MGALRSGHTVRLQTFGKSSLAATPTMVGTSTTWNVLIARPCRTGTHVHQSGDLTQVANIGLNCQDCKPALYMVAKGGAHGAGLATCLAQPADFPHDAPYKAAATSSRKHGTLDSMMDDHPARSHATLCAADGTMSAARLHDPAPDMICSRTQNHDPSVEINEASGLGLWLGSGCSQRRRRAQGRRRGAS